MTLEATHAPKAGAKLTGAEYEADPHTFTGTLPVANLPVGTGSDEVAAGDHGHPGGGTPTLAEVLAEGNDPGGTAIASAASGPSTGASLTIAPAGEGFGGSIEALAGEGNDGVAVVVGGASFSLYGGEPGEGGGGIEFSGGQGVGIGSPDDPGGSVVFRAGNTGDAVGARLDLAGAVEGTGGDATLTARYVFLAGLPTADPEVAGALFTDGAPGPADPKPLYVSGGPA